VDESANGTNDLWNLDTAGLVNGGYPVPSCNIVITAPAGFGTTNDPYQIASLNNLYWLSATSAARTNHCIQTADIRAYSTARIDFGKGFSPIGNEYDRFSGSYDGQAHTIRGLTIRRTGQDNVGLFSYVSAATLRNIRLVDAVVEGRNYVGSLVGWARESALIEDCHSANLRVGGYQNQVGGLFGVLYDSTARRCWVSGTVSCSAPNPNDIREYGGFAGELQANIGIPQVERCRSACDVLVPSSSGASFAAGGLAGWVGDAVVVVDCYASGSVIVPQTYWVGGFGGVIQPASLPPVISNCYSVGSVTGLHPVGGFAGYKASATITACFWDIETSGLTNSAAGTGTNTVAMKTQTTFTGAGWDFDGVWHMTEGVTYPLLSDLSACITATAGANGSIAPSGTVYVALGDSISFTISPEVFYHVADVATNSVSVGPVLAFTWENVITNGAIHAEFAANEAARGTPEWWLASYGLTNGGLSFDQAEVSDTDGDSQPAWKEWIADTNPTNSASCFGSSPFPTSLRGECISRPRPVGFIRCNTTPTSA